MRRKLVAKSFFVHYNGVRFGDFGVNASMSNQSSDVGGGRAGMLKELLNNAQLVWRLLLDPNVSLLAKLVPVGALLYLFMPFDLIPDVIPGLGQLDDVAIVLLGIRAFIALSPQEVVRRYRRDMGEMPDNDANQSSTIEGTYRVVDE